MSSGKEAPYRLVFSQAVRRRMQELYLSAKRQGRATESAAAVRICLAHLRGTPLEFGEPTHHLRALELEMRNGVVSPLAVRYGVHRQRRLVFIQEFTLLGERE